MSIVQGGPGFPVLADATYRYMTTGETTNVKVSDEDLPLQLNSIVSGRVAMAVFTPRTVCEP